MLVTEHMKVNDSSGRKKVVVIGGGTGTFTVLSGLKHFVADIELSAIVTMADSGGSTGRLRDEFGYLPVGDVRMALVALADEQFADNQLLRNLLLYRFTKGGKNLAGHNFGNLFLVALTDILGSELEAIRFAARMLRACGSVHPVTLDHVTLVATYDDGVVIEGEVHIDESEAERDRYRIVKLEAHPHGHISNDAERAILDADCIVMGPGDLYTSILAVCVVGGVREALQKTNGTILYVSNLMTKRGQTSGMCVEDHVREVERYIGRAVDTVLANDAHFSDDLKKRYAMESEYPVLFDGSREVEKESLLATEEVALTVGDVLRRSLIRHNSDALAQAIMKHI